MSLADVRPPAAQSRRGASAPPIRVTQLLVSLAIGGSERLAATIGQALDAEEFATHFLGLGDDGAIGEGLRAQGYTATALHRRAHGIDPRLFFKIRRFLSQHPSDILQSHHVASLIYGAPVAWLSGVRVIHTEHELGTFKEVPKNVRWLHRLRRFVTHFLAIDPFIADFFAAQGIPRERISVIRNGIDLEQFAPPAAARGKDRPIRLGWVGRMDVPKRPEVLVEALALLRKRYPDTEVVFVGPGPLVEPTRQQAEALGVATAVDFLGGRTDIADLLREMDVFVLLSEREGLPIALVEAMATARPCVVSAVGGIPDLIRDGENGLLLDKLDAEALASRLLSLLDQPSHAAALGQQARTDVGRLYNLQTTIEQYQDLYRRVARQRPA